MLLIIDNRLPKWWRHFGGQHGS